MTTTCTRDPISWLTLELYQLGELPAPVRARVQGHLEGCAACAACLARIQAEDGADEGAGARAAARAPAAEGQPPGPRWRRRRWWITGVVAAAAAGRLLVAGPRAPRQPPAGSKGADVAVTLVRERAGVVSDDATTFRPEDRFKVLITCASTGPLAWQFAVVQSGRVSLPLGPGGPLACGNRVPLPGAFRLPEPRPAEACLIVLEPAQQQLRALPRDEGEVKAGTARCLPLRPE
jgi:hypothetical protein